MNLLAFLGLLPAAARAWRARRTEPVWAGCELVDWDWADA